MNDWRIELGDEMEYFVAEGKGEPPSIAQLEDLMKRLSLQIQTLLTILWFVTRLPKPLQKPALALIAFFLRKMGIAFVNRR